MESLRSQIESEMERNLQILEAERKYWYPLSEPTYFCDEVLEAIDSMLTFKTTMWDKTKKFESLFGDKFNSNAVMVNSGSSADLLISFGLLSEQGGKLNKGDEILVPAITWPTHLWSILMAGFKVRLIDVDRKTLNIDIADLKRKIGKNSKALFLVHLMGNMANMDSILQICAENNLLLLEDSCESLGSRFKGKYAGTFGLASSFSFFFSHHITTMEGGMILSQDTRFIAHMKLLRAHGWTRYSGVESHISGLDSRYTFTDWGFNVRPTELQAAFGIHQIQRINEFANQRKRNADRLISIFSKYSDVFNLMLVEPDVECSWFAFPVLIRDDKLVSRFSFTHFLEENGIETRPIIAGNIAKQPAMSKFKKVIKIGKLPGADYIHERGFYIGISPIENEKSLDRVENLLNMYFTQIV